MSDGAMQGGVAAAILEFFAAKGVGGVMLKSFEYPDQFVLHGKTNLVEETLGVLPEQIAKEILA